MVCDESQFQTWLFRIDVEQSARFRETPQRQPKNAAAARATVSFAGAKMPKAA